MEEMWSEETSLVAGWYLVNHVRRRAVKMLRIQLKVQQMYQTIFRRMQFNLEDVRWAFWKRREIVRGDLLHRLVLILSS